VFAAGQSPKEAHKIFDEVVITVRCVLQAPIIAFSHHHKSSLPAKVSMTFTTRHLSFNLGGCLQVREGGQGGVRGGWEGQKGAEFQVPGRQQPAQADLAARRRPG
jgi:hypothetical protein